MKLLAQLPHVAEPPMRPVVPSDEPSVSTRTTSDYPAFADPNDLEEQRIPGRHQPRPMRFIDQAHVEDEWDEDYQPRPRSRTRQQVYAAQRSHRSVGAGRMLSEAHEQLAPFAGLIVTAALLAGAGLLFLMMVGSKQVGGQLDELALPGFSVDVQQEFQLEDPPLADSEYRSPSLEPPGFEYEPPVDGESVDTLPADSNATVADPVIDQITDANEPLGELSFPNTGTPLALDLSKAFAPSNDDLVELPAVAERDVPATSEPINR